MTVALAHINFDCADPRRLAEFWSQVLDRPVDEGSTEFFATIDDHLAGAPSWFFIQVPEPKTAKNRLHLDFAAVDREAEITRLVSLGAIRHDDFDEWGHEWTVLTDPEGNEFCVGQQK